jgi:hypothetical protein
MANLWQRLSGKKPTPEPDEMEEVRQQLERLKSQGGPAIEAHNHCKENRQEIEESSLAGCFYCCEIFTPSAITEWLEEGVGTAMCPYCDIDSVIGDASGFAAGDKAFLKEMNGLWF